MDTYKILFKMLATTYFTIGQGCDRSPLHDCQDYQRIGFTESGVYHVTPLGTYSGFNVYCDMVTEDGGWLIFQRRQDGSVDFFNNWSLYQSGFGNTSGEYWLGNLPLYTILRQGHYELRVDLEDIDGKKSFAKYEYFKIGAPEQLYKFVVQGYSGTAGNNMRAMNGRAFTTKDKDNDVYAGNCAEVCKGGWWYDSCHFANPNGLYFNASSLLDGVSWNFPVGLNFLKKSEMKIRRR